MRIWELAALLALSISLCAGAWAEARQSSISSRLIRLHVIAASDETQEQEIKLRVRDAVLEYLAPRLDGATDAEAARELIAANTDGIAKAAESAAEGRTGCVTLGRERYPTRRYDGFALPAGEYESLRVILGEGEGHNWWCVAFPPLCTDAVTEDELRAAMETEDYGIISEQDGEPAEIQDHRAVGEPESPPAMTASRYHLKPKLHKKHSVRQALLTFSPEKLIIKMPPS